MQLDRRTCYRIVQARDARYDGRFFTCVKTTGIYCRPICPARPPKLENCIFVPSAAVAQEAGFRPCLRCRPECSPELGPFRGTSSTVKRALLLIEGGALDEGHVEALAERLGVGSRQLRRLFRKHLGASPITVALTRRVLLAKQLLHETNLSMTEVALASGFTSLRRFHETFKAMVGRPPRELRRSAAREGGAHTGLRVYLPYKKPYDFPLMLSFLKARAIAGVEHVTDTSYARTIELDGQVNWLEVSDCAERAALCVTLHVGRVVALPAIIARVRRMFDLAADPQVINEVLARDALLAPLVARRPGLRLLGAWDPFEMAVRAVVGQQITVAAATRLLGELVALLGKRKNELPPGLTHAFPQPACFRMEVLARLGMPRARVETLFTLANALREDPGLFEGAHSLDDVVSRLIVLRGIGPWSAHYIAMRGLSESDALPEGDVGLLRALAADGVRPSQRELVARAEAWRPYRSYAVVHLWMHNADESARTASRARAPKRVGRAASAQVG